MFQRIFKLSRSTYNTLPVLARNSKIMEELGEFSEALLHKLGFLPHKTMKESIFGEAADVLICTLDTLADACPELTEEQLEEALIAELSKKSDKWERIMKLRYEELYRDTSSHDR